MTVRSSGGPGPRPRARARSDRSLSKVQLERKDLQVFIGTPARISEILNRRRELTLPMIRKLNEGLHIPAALLIKSSKNRHL